MAEERFESRSEPASSRRLREARARGEVPRSAELASLAMLLAAAGALSFGGGKLFQGLVSMLAQGLQGAATLSFRRALELAADGSIAALPILVGVFLAALIAPLLLSGWVFAPQVMGFQPRRLDPLRPLKRLFSLDSLYGAVKALLASILFGVMVWGYLGRSWPELRAIWIAKPQTVLPNVAIWLGKGFMILAGGVALIALLDALWQWWRYLSGLAMSRSEVLAEAREEEMSAAVRARMANSREEVSRRAVE
ncbi:MAG: EscU/YscU/HrcU family type III secretion system export apparatus switch protein [Thiobacillaceae bacterium]